VAGPDATSLTHTAVIRLRGILETIRFDTGSMARKAQKLRDYQGSAMSKMVGGFRRQEAFDLARNEANPVNLEQSLMYVGEIMKR
jgi:adenylosuccinate lyase